MGSEISMDTFSKEKRSDIMRAVRGKNTKMEIALRKELSKRRVRYRKNVSDLLGKPDIAFLGKKVVVFLDSCFWHGCNRHCRLPKANKEYWTDKIAANQKRDKTISKKYKEMGWQVLRFWEHDLKLAPQKAVSEILKLIKKPDFSLNPKTPMQTTLSKKEWQKTKKNPLQLQS